MNRLKKAMALGLMSVMVVTSAGFAEMQAASQTMSESTGTEELLLKPGTELDLGKNTTDLSGDDEAQGLTSHTNRSAQVQGADISQGPWVGKISSFRGRDVQKSTSKADPDTQRGDKEHPVYLTAEKVIKYKANGIITPVQVNQFGLAENCQIKFYTTIQFDTEIDKIEINPEANAVLPIHVKIIETFVQSGVHDKREFYFVLRLIFDDAPGVDKIFNTLPTLLDDGIAQGGTRNLKMKIMLNGANDKESITKDDIKLKDAGLDVEFYGKDQTFVTQEGGTVNLSKDAPTSLFFKVQKGSTEYRYELEIHRPTQQQPQNPQQNQQNQQDQQNQQPQPKKPDQSPQTGGGSSSQSSVRPDSSTGGSSDTKNDVKKDAKNDMKQDAKKADEKKTDMKNTDQKNSAAESKVSTKLMIGETKYTVVVDGVATEKTADVAPMVHMGRTVLPARMISEILGVTVKFESATKTASFMYGENNKVELVPGQKYMLVNGQKVELTADILNKDGRILLPLKDIQNAFNQLGLKSNISWDSATKSVNIEK